MQFLVEISAFRFQRVSVSGCVDSLKNPISENYIASVIELLSGFCFLLFGCVLGEKRLQITKGFQP